jgi:WD40 repeat protein
MQAVKRRRIIMTSRLSRARKWLLSGPLHVQGIWDIIANYGQEFEGICAHALTGHFNIVRCLAALPDGEFASGSDDKTVRV